MDVMVALFTALLLSAAVASAEDFSVALNRRREPSTAGLCANVIQLFGYACSEHTAQTKDGYILGLQRVASASGKETGPPVLLIHGLFMDMDAFSALQEELLQVQEDISILQQKEKILINRISRISKNIDKDNTLSKEKDGKNEELSTPPHKTKEVMEPITKEFNETARAKEKQPIIEEALSQPIKIQEANKPKEESSSDERSKPTFKEALKIKRNPGLTVLNLRPKTTRPSPQIGKSKEEFLSIAQYVRNTKFETDHWIQSIDNEHASVACTLPGADPIKVASLFEFGLLRQALLGPKLKEIDLFPYGLKSAIKGLKKIIFKDQAVTLSLDIVASIPDWDKQNRFFSPYSFLSIKRFSGNLKATNQSMPLYAENQFPEIRKHGIINLIRKINKIDKTSNVKINFANKKQILTTGFKKKTPARELLQVAAFENQFYEGTFEASEECKKMVCKHLKQAIPTHTCKWCVQPASQEEASGSKMRSVEIIPTSPAVKWSSYSDHEEDFEDM